MNFLNSFGRLLLLLFLIGGCRQQESDHREDPVSESDVSYDLVVQKEMLRLRGEAGPEGEVLQTLPRGAKLKDLGEVSNFTSRIQLDGEVYNEPWIRVQTATGEKGWVYARVEDFTLVNGQDSTDWQYQKRLLAYFGTQQMTALTTYRRAFEEIRSLTDFAKVYQQGRELRTTLVQTLEQQMTPVEIEQQPDLFWLSDVIPAFVPQLVAEGTAYYLFADYRQWLRRAHQTAEPDDDAFVRFCISIFPQDSIEYFYPVWKIQTWDYGGHSLLGRGHHLTALRAIDQLSRQSKVFQPYLLEWKQALIDDITAPETTYWEEQPAALNELKQIMSAGFEYLNRDDKVALETRRKQFENATRYDVKFNYKSGVY